MFEIDDTPMPAHRLVASKYDEMFSKIRPGQCFKVDSDRVGTIQNAFRRWLASRERTDVVVRTARKMPDGYGRIWMLPKTPPKMADVPGRKIVNLGR